MEKDYKKVRKECIFGQKVVFVCFNKEVVDIIV